MSTLLTRLQRRLDKEALEQLRTTAAQLHDELERARIELARAQDDAEYWYETAQEMMRAVDDPDHSTHRCIGLTQQGHLLVVDKGESANEYH